MTATACHLSPTYNPCSATKGQAAIREIARVMVDHTGNLPPMPGIFPDYAAPIIRNGPDGRKLVIARWAMPSPAFALRGRTTDPGVTNIRNAKSPYWRRWLGPEHRPLASFAGVQVRDWTSTRTVKKGEVTTDLYGFLTTEANAGVGAVHPMAMPVTRRRPTSWRRG